MKEGEIFQNGSFWFWIINGFVFSQGVPVPEGNSATSVHFDGVLMVLVDFDNCPSLVPFVRVGSNLVLNSDLITDVKGGRSLVCSFHFS